MQEAAALELAQRAASAVGSAAIASKGESCLLALSVSKHITNTAGVAHRWYAASIYRIRM